jgi:hypothetical protein
LIFKEKAPLALFLFKQFAIVFDSPFSPAVLEVKTPGARPVSQRFYTRRSDERGV